MRKHLFHDDHGIFSRWNGFKRCVVLSARFAGDNECIDVCSSAVRSRNRIHRLLTMIKASKCSMGRRLCRWTPRWVLVIRLEELNQGVESLRWAWRRCHHVFEMSAVVFQGVVQSSGKGFAEVDRCSFILYNDCRCCPGRLWVGDIW